MNHVPIWESDLFPVPDCKLTEEIPRLIGEKIDMSRRDRVKTPNDAPIISVDESESVVIQEEPSHELICKVVSAHIRIRSDLQKTIDLTVAVDPIMIFILYNVRPFKLSGVSGDCVDPFTIYVGRVSVPGIDREARCLFDNL